VVAVDLGVQPPSYGIEISGQYRETEAHRLQPLPEGGGLREAEAAAEELEEAEEEEEAIVGLGHYDERTMAAEDAVRQLEALQEGRR
jgi:hypothetical protein